jgi:putative sterol carrier protein
MRPLRCFLLAAIILRAGAPALTHEENKLVAASPTDQSDNNTSIEQLFDDMKKSFRVDKAKGVHIRYQFRFSEPKAGDRWIIVNDGMCTMGKGIIEHPDVTFSSTGADWLELSNGTLSGFRAYITGRLHVKGSQSLARKLDELFP